MRTAMGYAHGVVLGWKVLLPTIVGYGGMGRLLGPILSFFFVALEWARHSPPPTSIELVTRPLSMIRNPNWLISSQSL